jgi:uncharacterized protein (DUF934 family)
VSKLIKDGAFAADNYAAVGDDAALPEGAVLVSLARFRKDRETLLERNAPLGVQLAAHENPELLGEDVNRLSLVALEFPKFRDGRAFSWARMLRERFDYKGEIRAVGHFVYDQLAFMARVGFDAFDVRQDFRIEDFDRAMREMTYVYQPSVDRRKTVMNIRRGE